MRVAVIDSGLGGVSILPSLIKRADHIQFFNIKPSEKRGFNSYTSKERRESILKKALKSIKENYNPDMVLIASNTLSSIFYRMKKPNLKTEDMISVSLSEIRKHGKANIILFATPITVKEGIYRNLLKKEQIKPLSIACDHLAHAIGEGDEKTAKYLIQKYVKKAAKEYKKAVAVLLCTHYGYYLNEFQKQFKQQGVNVKIINPNDALAKKLKIRNKRARIEVISKVKIGAKVQRSLQKIIKSKKTLSALSNYTHKPDFF